MNKVFVSSSLSIPFNKKNIYNSRNIDNIELLIFLIQLAQQSCNKVPGLKRSVRTRNYFSYFSTKYVVCSQKNRLDETVLLNTQNLCLN